MNQFIEQFFNFHKRYRAFVHVLFWILLYGLGIVVGNSEFLPKLTFEQNLVWHLMMMISKIPIAYWLVYISIPLFFDKKKYILAILSFYVVYYFNFCLSTAYKIIVYPYYEMFVVKGLDQFQLSFFFKDYFLQNLGAAAFLVLIKLLLFRSEAQIKNISLEKQKSEIELKFLKAQLNPHFLFNTLNNLYSLSLSNSPKTSESIARLSEILDSMLYKSNKPFVPISQEVKLIENYIELEKLRYSENLSLVFNKEMKVDLEIAPLILLTFVENAFKHGVSQDLGNPWLHINLITNQNQIVFEVENSAMEKNNVQEKDSEGIGLNNLRKQLDLIYKNNYKLEVKNTAKSFRTKLQIEISK